MTARTLTRHTYARLLHNRSKRLLRLIELGAPEIVIENERQLVLQAVLDFPVDSTAQAQRRISQVQGRADDDEFHLNSNYTPPKREAVVVDARTLDAIFGRC